MDPNVKAQLLAAERAARHRHREQGFVDWNYFAAPTEPRNTSSLTDGDETFLHVPTNVGPNDLEGHIHLHRAGDRITLGCTPMIAGRQTCKVKMTFPPL